MSSFLGNFYKLQFFWPNLKIEIRGQFVNLIFFEGLNYNFWKFEGSIYNYLEIYWGQIGKFEDQNENFEKLQQWRILKFLAFRCHLKFSKFNLDKILHKFPSFWKFFKLLPKQWNSPQSIWIPSSKHTLNDSIKLLSFFNTFIWIE